MMIRILQIHCRWLGFLVALLLAVTLAAQARAAEISPPPATFGPTATNWDTVLSFDRFDPALGTLTQVEVTLTGAINGDAKYESTDPNATNVTLQLAANVNLQRPNNNDILIVNPATQRMVSPGPYDGTPDFGGSSGGTLFNLTGSDSDTTVLTNPADLALFIGTGQIQLPASARGASSDNGSGNLITEYTVRAEVSVEVIYTYQPLIQPGISLEKTVYSGHTSGAGCPGQDLLGGTAGTPITYCFAITNIGDTYLTDLTVVDPALGIALNNLQPVAGNPGLPLAPNATLVYYYQTTLTQDLDNTATVEGQPSESNGTPLAGVGRVSASDDAGVRVAINATVTVCKEDQLGNPLANWQFEVDGPYLQLGTTDATGCVTIPVLLPGNYTISEVDQPGWQQITPPNDDGYDVTIQNGSVLGPFTFVNTPAARVRVCKVDDRTGQPLVGWQFNLGGPQPQSRRGGSNGCTTFNVTQTGTYTITETLQPGWTQVFPANPPYFVVDVVGPIQTTDRYPPSGGYTFRNRTGTEVRIVKEAFPPDGTDFAFTGDLNPFVLDDAVPDDGDAIRDTLVLTGVLPGTYTLNELLPVGWDLVDVVCNDADSGGLTGTTFTLVVDPLEQLSCTITNAKRGRLVVTKQTTTASTTPFTMTVTGPGLPTNPLTFALQNGGRYTVETLPGELYSIVETPSAGWINTSATCSNGQTPAGGVSVNVDETVTCTFVNAGRPQLTVIKQVENNFGGTATPGDFTIQVTGTGVDTAFPGDANGVTVQFDQPGSFQVTEVAVNGYSGSFVGTCAGVLNVDERATCTITNRDAPPRITIIKAATPADGQDVVFQGDLGAFTLDDAALDDGDAFTTTRTFAGLQPGSYTVSEIVPDGWRLVDVTCSGDANDSSSWDGQSTLTLDLNAAEDLVCTFTNTLPAQITLVKEVINNDGGTATANEFALQIGSTMVNSNEPLTVLPNVTYAISEVVGPGYRFVSITGDPACPTELGGTVTPAPGESIVCTITNDDQPASGGEPGTIGDRVWIDSNGDGLQNEGPTSAVPGVTVRLYTGDGTFTGQSATTDAAGRYSFTDLPPGVYLVEFVLPVDGKFTSSGAGSDRQQDSDADPATGRSSSITLPSGGSDNSVDAGLVPPSGLLINKVADHSEVLPGDLLTYTITYTNVGGIEATGVVVTETVPNFTTFLPARSTVGWTCAGQATVAGTLCHFTVESLAPGTSGSLSFVVEVVRNVRVPLDGLVIFNAVIIGQGLDPLPPTRYDRPTRVTPPEPTNLGAGEEPAVGSSRLYLPFVKSE